MGYEEDHPSPNPLALIPKERPVEQKKDTKPELTPQQRHMNEIMADKKANDEAKRLILMHIEEDKRNRRYKKERERVARMHALGQQDGVSGSGGAITSPRSSSGDTRVRPESDNDSGPEPKQIHPSQGRPKRRAKPWEDWATMPEELRTEWEPKTERQLTDAQARALGIIKNEDDK